MSSAIALRWVQNPLDTSVNTTSLGAMNAESPDREVYERMARLEEGLKTMKAEYEGALDRNNAAFERLRADMALHREDGAKRDKANIQWIVGTVFGATVLIIAFMSLLVRWPI